MEAAGTEAPEGGRVARLHESRHARGVPRLEAAGIEPDYGGKSNWLALRDFGRIGLQNGRLPAPSPFPSSPLESPRVPPSRGGILEAARRVPAAFRSVARLSLVEMPDPTP